MSDIFVTGGTGFIGTALVRLLASEGHAVSVLCRSQRSAGAAAALGATHVEGDLLNPGKWQERAAAAGEVLHLAQPVAFDGHRVSQSRADAYRRDRLAMDKNLLDAVSGGRARRVVYVGGTSYYGDVGTTPKGEDTPPKPRGWGPYIAPAISALDTYIEKGLPIVAAFPGAVYGEGSWFRQYVYGPLRRRLTLNAIGPSRVWSPVHIDDCARALSFLRENGEIGQRYFVVDDRPCTMDDVCRRAAAVMGVPMRTRRIPVWLGRLLLGPVIVDSMQSDAALSNARLRRLGWRLRFPTIDEGIPDVVARLDAARARS